ncbi:UDP-glycosyltransferase TURAN [Vitis vinifera]|uniref:UDP-glycosyltransferase TURAN n=1 Tax=Vitis vinifera TaxID=29760 RepID=A0A438KMQ4_VITVI|nr:UDP-glycosyltransferase TURAN [Vitis vinifera]
MSGRKEENIGRRGRAAVVVLGDIGRSPRMQYHALSLARQASLEVDIVAYGDSINMIGTISDEFGRLGKFKSILSSYEDRRLPLKMRINEEGNQLIKLAVVPLPLNMIEAHFSQITRHELPLKGKRIGSC